MDTTETYIKMCEKAEAIQEEWLPQVGDVFAHKRDKEKRVVERNPIYEAGCGHSIADEGDLLPLAVNWSDRRDRYIWLPRQDQLQEMVEVEEYPYTLVEKFWSWFDAHNNSSEHIDFESMEQLTLAFVQKENHGKVWTGEDWVKEEK